MTVVIVTAFTLEKKTDFGYSASIFLVEVVLLTNEHLCAMREEIEKVRVKMTRAFYQYGPYSEAFIFARAELINCMNLFNRTCLKEPAEQHLVICTKMPKRPRSLTLVKNYRGLRLVGPNHYDYDITPLYDDEVLITNRNTSSGFVVTLSSPP